MSNNDAWSYTALDQAIENVLLTEPYERIFNLGFGSPLINILFENMEKGEEYVDTAMDLIEYWVPVKIDRSSLNIEKDYSSNKITFMLKYTSNDGMIRNHLFARRLSK